MRQDPGLAPFDVVVVPFPYTDRLAEKRRPALVVSDRSLQKSFGLLWLAMITSAANPRWACDVLIEDQASAALPAPSMVRAAKIATIDAARILGRIGRLSRRDAAAVADRLLAYFPGTRA
jgi:mRNA interferase MazF